MTDSKPSPRATESASGDPTPRPSEAGACDHCGALVYGDSIRCSQCKRFPIKMHQCPHCKSIAAASVDRCWKCGRVFEPDGDFL